jgi:hypothetical protein
MKYTVLPIFMVLPFWASAQINFDISRFNKEFETVEYLNAYDAIAWWTSDSVMTNPPELTGKLGQEWFCYPDTLGNWHATYGRLENGAYKSVFHYKVDLEDKVTKCEEEVYPMLANPFALALRNAYAINDSVQVSARVRMNPYVRFTEGFNIEVWLLPAFSVDGLAVFGTEFCYTFDTTGEKLLRKYEKNEKLIGFKPDKQKEIVIRSPDAEFPSIGSVFFAWYYKDYFKQIIVETNKSRSMPFKVEDGWTWVHADLTMGKD